MDPLIFWEDFFCYGLHELARIISERVLLLLEKPACPPGCLGRTGLIKSDRGVGMRLFKVNQQKTRIPNCFFFYIVSFLYALINPLVDESWDVIF